MKVDYLNFLKLSWGRSELTDRNVELYPQFFLELITTQLRFYMVSPQFSLLKIIKFYKTNSALTEITEAATEGALSKIFLLH